MALGGWLRLPVCSGRGLIALTNGWHGHGFKAIYWAEPRKLAGTRRCSVSVATAESGIGPREAATVAAEYAAALLKDAKSFRLEEIELDEGIDAQYWRVTFSLVRPRSLPQLIDVLKGSADGDGSLERQYKTFKVDASTGKVLGMTIRHVEGD